MSKVAPERTFEVLQEQLDTCRDDWKYWIPFGRGYRRAPDHVKEGCCKCIIAILSHIRSSGWVVLPGPIVDCEYQYDLICWSRVNNRETLTPFSGNFFMRRYLRKFPIRMEFRIERERNRAGEYDYYINAEIFLDKDN